MTVKITPSGHHDTKVTMKVRIILADDHSLFRSALRMSLESTPDIEVVGEAMSGVSALRCAVQTHPDVVCMDVNMPGLNGIEATRQLLASQPEVKVVAMSAMNDLKLVAEMMSAGASAYVSKMNAGQELPDAIRCVSQNQIYLSPELGILDLADLMACQVPARQPLSLSI